MASSSNNNKKDIINSKSKLSSSYDDVDSSLLTATLTSAEYCCTDVGQQNIIYEDLDLLSKKKCKHAAIDESANKCCITNKSEDYVDRNEDKENVQEDCYNYKSFEKFAGNNSDLNSTFYSYSTSSPSSSFRKSKNNNESCITNDLENKQYDDVNSLNSCNLFSDIRKTDDCSSNSSHVIADSNNCSTFASSSSISAAITTVTTTAATTITPNNNNKSKKSLSLSLSAKNQKENHHHKNFISKLPSGTSRGFENTFRILENQISTNHKKNLYLRRISEEYIPSLSSLMHDDNDDNNRTDNCTCSSNYDVINNITGGGDEYEDDDGAGAVASTSNSTLNKKFSTHTRTSPSTSSYYNSNEYGTEDSFNFLELELEAIKRLQQLNASYTTEITTTTTNNSSNSTLLKKRLNKNNNGDTSSNESITSTTTQATSSTRIKTDNDNNASVITSPINEILYGFNPNSCSSELTGTSIINVNNDDDDEDQYNIRNCKIIEENILEESITDYPECIYHIARGKDGRKYLRVVRSLLLDKVLCGNRVSQMTRAYDDIEAVTRLLEEKEKDLELTVQIGKELLTQNNRLENRINELENELKSANEDRSQLLHDLHQKNELIVILTNDVDDGDGGENDTPTLSKSITLDLLQRKIQSLQDENKSLKQEALQLAKQTDEVEEQERQLMENITVQLNSAHSQFDGLNFELERLKEENRLQHEQIISLTARLSETEMRLHQLTTENDEQGSLLSITKENQNMLASELTEFKTRYQEVLALLQEAQEQLRKYRKKTQPHARNSFISNLGIPQPDSLHSELMESSMYSENSLDSGISTDRISGILGGIGMTNPQYKRIFETVKCAAKSSHYSDGMSHLGAMALSSSSQPRMTPMPYIPPLLGLGTDASSSSSSNLQHRPSSVYSGSNFPSFESSSLGVKTMSCESLISQNSEDTYPTNQTGVPGVPGAKDLEAALKRLTSAEVLARRAMLSHAPAGTYSYEENYNTAPLGLRTPDSIMSTGSSGISNGSNQWRLPEKLQIVKPMEGSQTLHHWSRLATPTLSGLLEERPGVTIRGGRGLEDLGLQIYSLSDVEEDVEEYPGKQFQSFACVYTYTNSTVMHPDDGTQPLTFLSQSQLSSRMASASTSRQPSCPPTPRANLSRRNSCSTFSVNMGLASMLSERGIKAVTPSALNTPLGPNFSPTVTPCNSPEGSPTRSMSPEPLFGILSSGADLLRRKLIGNPEPSVSARQQQSQNKQQKIILSRLEKRALRSLRLLERVENMGLENIIATHPSAVSQLSSGIASRSASPMAQLTSLKNLHPFSQQQSASGVASASTSGSEDIQFYHNQLKYRLNKNIPSDLSDDSGTSSLSSMNSSCNFSSNNSGDKSRTTNQTLQQQENAQTSSVRTSTSAQNQRNNVDETTTSTATANATAVAAAAAAASDIRIKQMQRQKSRRNLKNGIGGQRPDLGTVGGRIRPDLGVVDTSTTSHKFGTGRERKTTTTTTNDQTSTSSLSGSGSTSAEGTVTQSLTQSFVGSISSLFFGRKGGWL